MLIMHTNSGFVHDFYLPRLLYAFIYLFILSFRIIIIMPGNIKFNYLSRLKNQIIIIKFHNKSLKDSCVYFVLRPTSHSQIRPNIHNKIYCFDTLKNFRRIRY